MRKQTMILAGAALATVLALTGGGLALAAGNDDDENVTGADADRAVAAALAEVGGGAADGVERDSEGDGTWEVEVRKPDGTTVEVHLDADFAVKSVESDDEESPDAEDR
jgi:hypothetical protein